MDIRRIFTTIDTHTAGGPTRIITSGVPYLRGNSLAEKFDYFKQHYDSIRKLLLTEPRGHKDMYGAVITEAIDPNADLGMFFMTASGYLPTCVHSSIGVATALLYTGVLKFDPQKKEFVFETPSGLIMLEPNFGDGKLISIGLQTQPAYVQEIRANLRIGKRDLDISLMYSGVFFVLIEAGRNGLELRRERLSEFAALGQEVLEEANRSFETRHPDLPALKGYSLALFYEQIDKSHFKDIVVGRTGNVDRSPCGAGSGALAVLQSVKEELDVGEVIDIEGVTGTHFSAKLIRQARIGAYLGGVPQICGNAYVTGLHQFILEDEDPLKEGCVF